MQEAVMLRSNPFRVSAVLPLPRLLTICLAFTACSVLADENESQVLSTPPLTLGTSLSCLAANVGTKPVILDIAAHDVNGTVMGAARCTLPPGAVNAGGSQCGAVQSAPAGFVGYCTFTVVQGQKKNIRAAILSHNSNEGPGSVPAALAAQ
jgi:hypothetical protein